MSQRRRSRRSEHKWEQLRIINSVLLIFLLMSASWATYTMLANNILAFRYVNILVIALLALLLLLSSRPSTRISVSDRSSSLSGVSSIISSQV